MMMTGPSASDDRLHQAADDDGGDRIEDFLARFAGGEHERDPERAVERELARLRPQDVGARDEIVEGDTAATGMNALTAERQWWPSIDGALLPGTFRERVTAGEALVDVRVANADLVRGIVVDRFTESVDVLPTVHELGPDLVVLDLQIGNMGGFAVASVIGVPIGLWFASVGGWRLPFVAVGGLILVAALASSRGAFFPSSRRTKRPASIGE